MPKMIWAAVLVLLSLLQAPAYAADAFEISLMFFYDKGYYDGVYYAPKNNIIKVREDGPPRPLKVVLKNISSSSQRLNTDMASGGLDLITFEMTDERGNNNIVTKKVDPIQTRAQGYEYIGPGKTKEFEIMVTEREWNNAYKLAKDGVTKVRARVTYKNGSTVISSPYYTIMFAD